MNQKHLISSIKEHQKACLELIKRKNSDYAKDDDAFSNFRGAEMIGISAKKAILVRILDKISRLANILKNNDIKVQDESVTDSCRDVSNYALIYAELYLEENKNTTKNAKQKHSNPTPLLSSKHRSRKTSRRQSSRRPSK